MVSTNSYFANHIMSYIASFCHALQRKKFIHLTTWTQQVDMSGAPFVLFLMVSTFAVGKVEPCDAHDKTNGCSIPFGWNYFYKDIFKPDCDKHDICYSCVRMKSEKFILIICICF